jgi:cellulose synthase/poly-beta-1,6-N-acetylglucosamine synthase-like glycosyltransferase
LSVFWWKKIYNIYILAVLNYSLIFIIFCYSFLVIILLYGWLKISIFTEKKSNLSTIVSIIIPVRNEVNNIEYLLQSIENQSYSKILFEVIVVNDYSNDGTFAFLNKLKETFSFELKIIDLQYDISKKSPKKFAINTAIQSSKGALIITTDGDCIVEKNWLEKFVNYYEVTGCKFISGPVTFHNMSFFDRLQIVEFASLVGSGAASIALNSPNMCNGANIAYEKVAFEAVNGFEGFENIASGDDEFLMHKIAEKYPNSIGFLKDKSAFVKTNAQPTLKDFFNQRKRWASKWDKYLNVTNSALAVFIFLANLSLIVAAVLSITGNSNTFILATVGLKIILEWFFIGSVLWFLGYAKLTVFIPLVQLIYPFYVCFTALNSTSKSYIWKGRTY